MKERSSLPCVLSLVFGIATYPLSIFTFICFICTCLGRIPTIKEGFLVLFIIMIIVTAISAISSIVFGIIGIKQKSKHKRKAILGVILSSINIVVSLCFYCVVLTYPTDIFSGLLYLINYIS